MVQKYLTPEGLKKIKEELKHRTQILRPKIIEKIVQAKELGDLSENAEYQDAREEQGFNEGKIAELTNLINQAQVIKTGGGLIQAISIGSRFKVESAGQVWEYTLVGAGEVDPAQGKISNESPLGRAFMDKKVGDEVEVEVPKGVMKYVIKEIN